MSFLAIGAGVGVVGAVSKFAQGAKQTKLSNQINPQYTPYQTSKYAQQSLGAAQNAYYGSNPAFNRARQGVLTSQANTIAGANRNAMSSADLLAVGGAAQGQSDAAMDNIGGQETQQKYGLLDNLQNAYGQLVSEDRFKQQDMLSKYQDDVNAKTALYGSGATNKANAFNDLSAGLIYGSQLWKGGKKKVSEINGNFPPNYLNTGG